MTIPEYRAHPAHNFSSLKHILTSTGHYIANRNAVVEETVPMWMGTALHGLWLEGTPPTGCVVKPEGMSFATKEGKAWREEHQGKGNRILTEEEWTSLMRRVRAIRDSKLATSLIAAMPHREKPLFGTIEGVECKALFDAHSNVAFLDLKTTHKNDPKEWGQTVLSRNYDLQAAFYRAVWRCNYQGNPDFYWVTVSDDASPAVVVYRNEPFIESGEEKLRLAIRRLKELEQYGEAPVWAELPFWARGE